MTDGFGRNIDYLRISITDRCNLRCKYCMPEDGVQMIDHDEILTFDEIEHLVRLFAQEGIRKIKITGGEPLVRKDVEVLIKNLYAIEGIEDITITTNGVLLDEKLDALVEAGVDSYNISLDTLSKNKYEAITRCACFDKVEKSIFDIIKRGNLNVKLNAVPMKGMEEDCLALARLAKDYDVKVRFIEVMPIGEGSSLNGLFEDKLMRMFEEEFGELKPLTHVRGHGPCHYVSGKDFKGAIGFISSISHKFCSSCNRLRLTCEGFLKPCLQYDLGVDLKTMLRNGESDEVIRAAIADCIKNKPRCHEFESMNLTDSRVMSKIGG